MSVHTPGPWAYRFNAKANYGRFETTQANVRHNDPVVFAVREDWTRHLAETSEGQANAALIAAAPEMLEALKALLKAADYTLPQDWSRGRPVSLARVAIAKAEGEATS